MTHNRQSATKFAAMHRTTQPLAVAKDQHLIAKLGALLNLARRYAPPFGPAVLVTQDPAATSASEQS